MAIEKVSISRKYHGKVPRNERGDPLPKSTWSHKRPHRWAVRWFGDQGTRYSRSFKTRKEAERFAEEKQTEVRDGIGDEASPMALKEYKKLYLSLRGDITQGTLVEHTHARDEVIERAWVATGSLIGLLRLMRGPSSAGFENASIADSIRRRRR